MITLNLTPEQETAVRNSLGGTQVDYKVSKLECIKALRATLKDCGLYEAKSLLDLFVLFQENKVDPTYLNDESVKVVDTKKIRQVMEFATNLFQPVKGYSIQYMISRGEWRPSPTYFPGNLQEAKEQIASYYRCGGILAMRILEDGKVIETHQWDPVGMFKEPLYRIQSGWSNWKYSGHDGYVWEYSADHPDKYTKEQANQIINVDGPRKEITYRAVPA
jgi:hypothetical protein